MAFVDHVVVGFAVKDCFDEIVGAFAVRDDDDSFGFAVGQWNIGKGFVDLFDDGRRSLLSERAQIDSYHRQSGFDKTDIHTMLI